VEREEEMRGYYIQAMKNADARFDADEFEAAYAVLGAERALRLMGLWPRLLKRDNKPHYMVHMARTQDYLRRNLAHPALSDLARFVEKSTRLNSSHANISYAVFCLKKKKRNYIGNNCQRTTRSQNSIEKLYSQWIDE